MTPEEIKEKAEALVELVQADAIMDDGSLDTEELQDITEAFLQLAQADALGEAASFATDMQTQAFQLQENPSQYVLGWTIATRILGNELRQRAREMRQTEDTTDGEQSRTQAGD